MTTYQYAGNNPVMMNDPTGNLLDISKQSRVATIGIPIDHDDDDDWYNQNAQSSSAGEDLADLEAQQALEESSTAGFTSTAQIVATANYLLNNTTDGGFSSSYGTVNTYNNSDSEMVFGMEQYIQMGGKASDMNGIVNPPNGNSYQISTFNNFSVIMVDPYSDADFKSRDQIAIFYTGPQGDYIGFNAIQTVNGDHIDNSHNGDLSYGMLFLDDSDNATLNQVSDQAKSVGINGFNGIFTDNPGQNVSNMSFSAEVSIVGITSSGEAENLGTFSWGFKITNGNMNNNPVILESAPSQYQQYTINAVNRVNTLSGGNLPYAWHP